DYVGFVFAPSRRQVTPDGAASLRARLDERVTAVGVFVEEEPQRIAELYERGLFEVAQLHGAYHSEQLDELKERAGSGLKIIRAVAVDENFAPDLLHTEKSVDYLLFDYQQPGSGRRFDWHLLKGVRSPYFLAGGISLENLDEALELRPFAVDVSSGVESDGLKDACKIREFIERVRRA
ncbi:MAG: phosphoribosylanthranilate isomerase, partial [Coriobacteriales bacterium]|nr:phosphoribosylanthranilate isomerase [Coriobacteriales bacterium]